MTLFVHEVNPSPIDFEPILTLLQQIDSHIVDGNATADSISAKLSVTNTSLGQIKSNSDSILAKLDLLDSIKSSLDDADVNLSSIKDSALTTKTLIQNEVVPDLNDIRDSAMQTSSKLTTVNENLVSIDTKVGDLLLQGDSEMASLESISTSTTAIALDTTAILAECTAIAASTAGTLAELTELNPVITAGSTASVAAHLELVAIAASDVTIASNTGDIRTNTQNTAVYCSRIADDVEQSNVHLGLLNNYVVGSVTSTLSDLTGILNNTLNCATNTLATKAALLDVTGTSVSPHRFRVTIL